ncbi:MAG: TolC family protein, partial [Porphyromonadaceae bacterium]|nr:TolC family protein [Porphyromonadaceae bacterium]
RVQIQQLQLQRLATQRQLELGLENARTEQRNALATFVAARDAVASASRGHEIARVRYSSGASTLLELNDAELALLQARLALSQAIHQYMISVFSLDELQGLDQLP